jgi:lon-related putative ATP-dependent protease
MAPIDPVSVPPSRRIAALPPERLVRRTDPAVLSFSTTAELTPLDGVVTQARAGDAIRLGSAIPVRGFNIFAIGASGGRVQEAVARVLAERGSARPTPPDWVYVNNFASPYSPRAIRLPAGRAPALQKSMQRLVEDLRVALPAAFESEDYQRRRGGIEEAIRSRGEKAFAALSEKATARGVAILRTPMGFAMAPQRDGQVVPPEQFNSWPEEARTAVQQAIQELEPDLERTLRSMPRLDRERRDAVRALDRETADFAVRQLIEEARAPFVDLPEVLDHLEAVRADLIENVYLFVNRQAAETEGEQRLETGPRPGSSYERYDVNVLVTQPDEKAGAPVVEELHPTLSNLVGRIEYLPLQGALVTNFRLIKPGALHRANGGTMLIDARALLSEPYSWPALKRALTKQRIVIEDVSRVLGFAATVSLEPDPIPLDAKVVLFGDRMLYYVLAALDPDFEQHFKILADFDDDAPRSAATEQMLARLIGDLIRRDGLKPLDAGAVGRVIDHAARLAEDASRLSLMTERLHELVVEANHWAGVAERDVVQRSDIDQAISERRRRAARFDERGREMILRDIALIDSAGARVGQINGLSVISLGGHEFGRPTRITARVRPGAGRIIDIEREVALGGPLHSKGVMILSGFLMGRYALDSAMSLSASLVFEQSYGGVDGDSASSAELYCLLSALADMPLRQDLAVTGSVNQPGEVQAIGGVNAKIEGFFDICVARGLTGTQGVLIPQSNEQHLMLREDVIEACAAGRFAVYPVPTIDAGIALLVGCPAGERGADGRYPEGSINRAVEDRLKAFAAVRRAMGDGREADMAAPREH